MTDPSSQVPVPTKLLEETQALAEELNIPWQRIITLALDNFLRKHHHHHQLVAQINAAYTDDLDSHEKAVLQAMQSTHRRIVENEW